MAEPNDKPVTKTEAAPITPPERTQSRITFTPRVDIREEANGLTLVADMPGVDEKNVQIDLDKGVLTISGHVEPTELDGHRVIVSEYRIGDYQRAFTLSHEVDTTKIEANVKDGVLRVRLPKAERAKERKIPVKAG